MKTTSLSQVKEERINILNKTATHVIRNGVYKINSEYFADFEILEKPEIFETAVNAVFDLSAQFYTESKNKSTYMIHILEKEMKLTCIESELNALEEVLRKEETVMLANEQTFRMKKEWKKKDQELKRKGDELKKKEEEMKKKECAQHRKECEKNMMYFFMWVSIIVAIGMHFYLTSIKN